MQALQSDCERTTLYSEGGGTFNPFLLGVNKTRIHNLISQVFYYRPSVPREDGQTEALYELTNSTWANHIKRQKIAGECRKV